MSNTINNLSFASLIALFALANNKPGDCYAYKLADIMGYPYGTVWPLLRRFERAGWAVATLEPGEPSALGRPKRTTYQLTPAGRRVEQLCRQRVLSFIAKPRG